MITAEFYYEMQFFLMKKRKVEYDYRGEKI